MRDALLVVTPARNEARYIGVTIDSMLRQSVRPAEWIIVDDGSTDDTAAIADEAARRNPWIRVVRKPARAERSVGIATVEAVALARKVAFATPYAYLAVIDADIQLPDRYFETILERFESDPKLGIAAGQVYDLAQNGTLHKMRGAPEVTAGAVKCWRTACFEQMGGLINEAGWDGIDQYQAALHGWTTRTFDSPQERVVHLRQMGSSHRGIWYGRFRRGRSGHYMGSHPVWMLASAAFHITDRPFAIASLCTLAGYFVARWRKALQVPDPVLRSFVRSSQLSKLRHLLLADVSKCRAGFQAAPPDRSRAELNHSTEDACRP